MDCKPPSSVKVMLRIEILLLQGILRAVLAFVAMLFVMPFIPFAVVTTRWILSRGTKGILFRLSLVPMWFLLGVVLALVHPFVVLFTTLRDTMEIIKWEWVNRWMLGSPKKPDGTPMEIPTETEKADLDLGATLSVIRDYNEEAKQHGQGLDIPPLK